jgi:hypothetical protein
MVEDLKPPVLISDLRDQNAPAFLNLTEESTRVELSYTDDEPLGAAKVSRERPWGATKIQQTQ